MTIVSVNPFRCRMWMLHDRLEEHLTEETCREEIKSFLKRGQLVPALGRRLHGDEEHEVELIYGARRLFVARSINKPILVELRDLSDREAIVAMDIENRQRADISPYERGLSYVRWLRSGHFNSQAEIAKELHVSESRVSRLLKLASLPTVILGTFATPVDIREEWGIELAEILRDEPSRRAMIQRCRQLARVTPRPSPREIFRHLSAAAVRGRKMTPGKHDQIVLGTDGRPLFRITQRNACVAVLLPEKKLSDRCMHEIRSAIIAVMEQNHNELAAKSRRKRPDPSDHEPQPPLQSQKTVAPPGEDHRVRNTGVMAGRLVEPGALEAAGRAG